MIDNNLTRYLLMTELGHIAPDKWTSLKLIFNIFPPNDILSLFQVKYIFLNSPQKHVLGTH